MKEATNGRYLLDANLLAAFFRGKKNALSLVTPWIAQKEATTSILVYGEIIEYLMGFADFTVTELNCWRCFETFTSILLPMPFWKDMLKYGAQCVRLTAQG